MLCAGTDEVLANLWLAWQIFASHPGFRAGKAWGEDIIPAGIVIVIRKGLCPGTVAIMRAVGAPIVWQWASSRTRLHSKVSLIAVQPKAMHYTIVQYFSMRFASTLMVLSDLKVQWPSSCRACTFCRGLSLLSSGLAHMQMPDERSRSRQFLPPGYEC